MDVTASPFSPVEVIFEIGIGFGGPDEVLKGRRMKGRPSEVGVDDHSGRIDDTLKARPGLTLKLLLKKGKEAVHGEEGFLRLQRFFLTEKILPEAFQTAPDGFDHNGSGKGLQKTEDLWPGEDLIHAGDLAKRLLARRHDDSSMKSANFKMKDGNFKGLVKS